ncbi:hypothetical protein JXB28_02650 [Candidatus Woesearchaeota archaeon]|nr:hypothetical protein [Candidatus Woesearchaeota archaeon]
MRKTMLLLVMLSLATVSALATPSEDVADPFFVQCLLIGFRPEIEERMDMVANPSENMTPQQRDEMSIKLISEIESWGRECCNFTIDPVKCRQETQKMVWQQRKKAAISFIFYVVAPILFLAISVFYFVMLAKKVRNKKLRVALALLAVILVWVAIWLFVTLWNIAHRI